MNIDELHMHDALHDVFSIPEPGESGYDTDVLVTSPTTAAVCTTFGIVFEFTYSHLEYVPHMNRWCVHIESVDYVHDDPAMFEE